MTLKIGSLINTRTSAMSYRTSITIYTPTPPWEESYEEDDNFTEPTEEERWLRHQYILELTETFLDRMKLIDEPQ